MLPLTRSRNRARFFGIPFSPSSLFAAGEQGAWYDPSDYSTLFTDSAGTTPVTGVEQFVGLMLDKSQGLVLGSELVTNPGPFANTTGWAGSNATIASSGGKLVVTDTGGTFGFSAYQAFNVTAGKWYKLSTKGKVVSGTSTVFQIAFRDGTDAATSAFLGGFTVNNPVTGVTYEGSAYYYATSTATVYLHCRGFFSVAPVLEYEFANVSEIAGNHAFQTSSAKRPKLAARYNLLTYSEEFDNPAWTKQTNVSIDPNAVTAPDGTMTADRVNWSAASLNTGLFQSGIPINGAANIKSIYVRADTAGGTITIADPNTTVGVTTAALTTNWQQIFLSEAAGAQPGTSGLWIRKTSSSPNSIYIWGADLRPASQATGLIGPTYQRVAAANVYDTAGFLPYLAFDGLDDSMSTNSIDFSATDKMTVWAGVRKLAGTTQTIAEISTNADTNNGSFNMAVVSGGALSDAAYISARGTSLLNIGSNTNTSPATYVHTGQYDIAAATNKLISRVNATQVAASGAGSAGTGNFGNYPLYIGARGGSTFPFNGWLTSLIVRGAQSTQSQIEAAEAWVNGKTGAY